MYSRVCARNWSYNNNNDNNNVRARANVPVAVLPTVSQRVVCVFFALAGFRIDLLYPREHCAVLRWALTPFRKSNVPRVLCVSTFLRFRQRVQRRCKRRMATSDGIDAIDA